MTPAPSSDRVGRHGFQLVLCCLFSLPFLANVVVTRLGYVVFYLADPKLQSVWGTLCLVLGFWALSGRRRTNGWLGFLLLVAAIMALGLYGRSLWAAYRTPISDPVRLKPAFGTESALMLSVAAGRLWDARRRSRR